MKKRAQIYHTDIQDFNGASEVIYPKEYSLRCKILGLPPEKMIQSIPFSPIQTIADIKRKVIRAFKMAPLRIQIVFNGTVLDDHIKIDELDYHLETDTLTIMCLIAGG